MSSKTKNQEYVVLEEEQPETEETSKARYRPSKLGVVELNKVRLAGEGEELDAIITRIRVGRVRDFVPIETISDDDIRHYYEERADRPAINIEFEVPDLGLKGEDTIIFSLHSNSRYIKLSRRYKEFKVGDKIKVVSEGGKLKIA